MNLRFSFSSALTQLIVYNMNSEYMGVESQRKKEERIAFGLFKITIYDS